MTPMMMLLILLGVMLAVLTVLLIYRSTLEMHEDDQLFLSTGESHLAREQEEVQTSLHRIEPAVKWLSAACGVLLLSIAAMWVYTGLNTTGTIR
jgi:membrane-associated PAP2 superfamily phosphatase